jgi:CheY-like chemotaxis protein
VPRVLLVNDDIAEISAVKRVLARAGHQAVLATSAADALAAVAQAAPAVVLVGASCDDGQAVRRFAESEIGRGIPMVVLGESAAAPEGAGLVPRPIDPEQLAAQVAAALAPAPASAAARPRAPLGKLSPPRSSGSPAEPPGSSRKAAAEALRARAEELRRGTARPPAAQPPAPKPTPKSAARPDRRLDAADAALAELEAPAARSGIEAEVENDPGLEAILRRAEDAERAHAAEKKARARQADRATVEAQQRAEAEQVAVEKAQRARAAEERARLEEEARKRADEEARRTQKEARRAGESARAEREARTDLQDELERLRRHTEEESRRREGDEEALRAAIASARAEMDALRRRGEDEARRRADAEAEVARLGREAERKSADAAAQPAPFDFPVYRPPATDPPPDPAQELARRRVAALRSAAPDAARAAPVEEPPAPEPAAPSRALRAPPPELRSGALADVPAPRLLALAARAELVGRLDFDGEASRSVYFEDGRVVGATSSDPTDRVEELALRLGLVTRDQYRAVAAAASTLATRRAAVVLLERGFLKPAELTGLVRRRTEEVVFGVFADPGARFRWSAAEVPPDERTVLERSTLQLAVEGVRRRWLAPYVDAVLGGDATLLAPIATGPTAADVDLSPDELRALSLADGLRTVDEIVAASPLDSLSTRQALAAMVLVGALAVRTFQGGRPASAATAAIDLARVRDKLDQVRRADYFTILGVGRLCTPHEVREAFERLRAELDPRRFQTAREDGLEARLGEIQRVLSDARDVLADDRLREEYLRGLGE